MARLLMALLLTSIELRRLDLLSRVTVLRRRGVCVGVSLAGLHLVQVVQGVDVGFAGVEDFFLCGALGYVVLVGARVSRLLSVVGIVVSLVGLVAWLA